MTGYLVRLIARSNGSEAVVRPLLTPAFGGRGEVELGAGLFADAVQDDGHDLRRERAEPARSIHTLPAPPSAAGLPTVGRSAARLNRTLNAAAEALRTRPAIGVPETQAAEPPSRAQRSLWPDESGQPDHAEPGHAASFSSPPQPDLSPSELTGARLEAAHASPSPGDPARVYAPPAALRSETDKGEPSAILRITIGRIEVRANLPRTALAPGAGSRAAQPARRFTVAPKLTLEQYLNRSEAQR